MLPRRYSCRCDGGFAPRARAIRRGWRVAWFPDQMLVKASGVHPANGESVSLQAELIGYRAQPPAWSFQPPEDRPGQPFFPASGPLPSGGGSIFHNQHRVICAHFNRLAYSDYHGPHGDWGGPVNWLEIRGYARATTLAAMLTVIRAHLKYSPGWLMTVFRLTPLPTATNRGRLLFRSRGRCHADGVAAIRRC
jgi:hypothetical protein